MERSWVWQVLYDIFGETFADEFCSNSDFEQKFMSAISELSNREVEFITRYYKFGKNGRSIASSEGLSPQRVYQIIRDAKRKIKYSYKLKSSSISRETKMFDVAYSSGMFDPATCAKIAYEAFWHTNLPNIDGIDFLEKRNMLTLGDVIDLIDNGVDLSKARHVGEKRYKKFLSDLKELREKFSI